MASSSNKICEYFTSSEGEGCPFGAMCNFSHDLSSGPSQGTTQPGLQHDDDHHTDSTRERQHHRRRPCHFFRNGFCKDGPRCKFSHGEAPVALPVRHKISQNQQRKRNKNICRFFLSPSGCRLGNDCRFPHEQETACERDKNDKKENDSQTPLSLGPETNTETARTTVTEAMSNVQDPSSLGLVEKPKSNRQNRRQCKYFNSANGCRLGEKCNFLHETKDIKDISKSKITDNKTEMTHPRLPVRGRDPGLYIDDMTESDQLKARDTEIEILKKRYPHAKEVPRGKNSRAFQIKFVPTDPDWPYDVKSLDMEIFFPPTYPKKMMDVSIPEQENLPETVRRCVMFSTVDWITARFKNFEKKGQVERSFRPFLRWLDRDLEDIFTDALTHYKRELVARAAGIEIIPARHLQARYQQQEDENENEAVETKPEVTQLTDAPEVEPITTESENALPDENLLKADDNSPHFALNPTPKGTEIKMRELQLKDSVATLVALTVKLIVRCSRCKEAGELSTPAERTNELKCSKCHQSQLVRYRPALIHSLSAVLGYLDLEDCTAFDLLLMDCQFMVNCMSCTKDNKIGGIPPGQLKNSWCVSCHSKMTIALEGVQFRQLQPAAIEKTDNAHKVQTAKTIRNIRDPAIKEGRPLPDNGTCRHYKKSFRWLRFPCCGKTYPCDTCHDTKEDHEMKFANRMLCGFCAHEQVFSGLKPCSACGSSMTSRPTEHWEGGKGCRDVIRMSRNDDKKFSNCNKTTSRKAQAKATQGKKATKLRHT